MTARIAGFITRAEAGLRAPRSVSRNINAAAGGSALHYGGPAQPAARPHASHALCVSTWRAWQRYHMDTHGWVDLAYTGGFCQHGYAFAGRGLGVRTAANGTDRGNATHYAFCWIGGEGQIPTPAAYDAAEWWIAEARRGGAGMSVKSHQYFKSTSCSGPLLTAHARFLDGKATTVPTVTPTTPTKDGPDMLVCKDPNSNEQFLIFGGGRKYITSTADLATYERVCPRVTLTPAELASYPEVPRTPAQG